MAAESGTLVDTLLLYRYSHSEKMSSATMALRLVLLGKVGPSDTTVRFFYPAKHHGSEATYSQCNHSKLAFSSELVKPC